MNNLFSPTGLASHPGGTLNVEVIGILVRNFLENPKKYPNFDFKPLKILKLQFLGLFLGLFWEKLLQFSKNFPEDPKKYQNQNFIP